MLFGRFLKFAVEAVQGFLVNEGGVAVKDGEFVEGALAVDRRREDVQPQGRHVEQRFPA